MYQNTPEETQYQLKEFDSQGAHLNGNHQYTVTFPKAQLPPVKGFWSLTLYNEQKFFSESAEPLLARHEKQVAEGQRGWLAHALPGREVSR
jgi:hypothetical protein